jgi:hypothetical protein
MLEFEKVIVDALGDVTIKNYNIDADRTMRFEQ